MIYTNEIDEISFDSKKNPIKIKHISIYLDGYDVYMLSEIAGRDNYVFVKGLAILLLILKHDGQRGRIILRWLANRYLLCTKLCTDFRHGTNFGSLSSMPCLSDGIY